MSKGRAKLEMSQGVSVWVLDAPDGFGDADFHAHHAIQITASLAGALSLTSADETLTAPILAVAADARHKFDAFGLLAFIFVEPESRLGRGLAESLFRGRALVAVDSPGIARHLEPLRATFDAPLGKGALLDAGRAVAEALAPGLQARLPDPRIQRIIEYAAAHLDEPLSLASASAGVHLSPSRLRHLFVEQTGLAFKTYLLWLRLVSAVALYSEGKSLTEAAHAAGFSDSAHFSRIFKRTFGLPATTLTRL
jgi:AraC-like DNA-binding protein